MAINLENIKNPQQSTQKLDLKTCAEIFCISVDTLRRFIKDYKIPYFNTGGKNNSRGKWMVRPVDIDDVFNDNLKIDQKIMDFDTDELFDEIYGDA